VVVEQIVVVVIAMVWQVVVKYLLQTKTNLMNEKYQ
jgi:hypothetical protein